MPDLASGVPVGELLVGTRVVDLAHPVRQGMPVWPGHPPLERSTVSSLAHGDVSEVGKLHLGEHLGTHVDAPVHFVSGGRDIADPAWVQPLRRLATVTAADPTRLTAADVERFETRHGQLRPGDALAVASGWDRYWGRAEYFGDSWPVVAPEVGGLLLDRQCSLLLVDTPSPDPDTAAVPLHRQLLAGGCLIGENTRGLDRLPPSSLLCAIPLPVIGGTGVPWRPVALVPVPS